MKNSNNNFLIITDCLNEKVDEGCIKVASSIAKRLKQKSNDNVIVSYGNKNSKSDYYFNLNKLFLNLKFLCFIKKMNKMILFIPFASNTLGSCIRMFFMSIFTKKNKYVIFTLSHKLNILSKILIKISKFKIICLSKETFDFYNKNGIKSIYLTTGVDKTKFSPINKKTKNELRKKYGFNNEDKIILHVGHLKKGRNVEKLLKIDEKYKIILVISSVTKADEELKKKLKQKNNITIYDRYISNIEEIYQISDLYFFPVLEKENCIDIPLSVLEACSCNLKVICTKYGELSQIKDDDNFVFIDSFEQMNELIDNIFEKSNVKNRIKIIKYDWTNSINYLLNSTEDKNEKI